MDDSFENGISTIQCANNFVCNEKYPLKYKTKLGNNLMFEHFRTLVALVC